MRRILATCTLAAAIGLAGCYHVTVNTGKQPGSQTIQNEWASSFIDGLVPPATVETAAQCPNGVALVETYHSFLNMLAAGLTLGIYTPLTIKVTCAAGGMSMAPNADVIHLANSASLQLRVRAIDYAAQRSVQLDHPVYVDYGK